MTDPEPKRTPTPGVGVVCFRNDQVLLVKRGQPPLEGRWSLPGGRIEWGERAADAALRELKEETSCEAELVGLVDVVDGLLASSSAPEAPWGHYVLIDYAARWRAGEPMAGDDAVDARFFSRRELSGLGLWAETLRIIEKARTLV
ncbi:MAG: NUDIX hydrolase [Hyphomonadaceae bacterium]|nr:NUDIX hydrolase [Hyphomonadaceae bacterium]